MNDREQFEKHYRETRGANDRDFQKLSDEHYQYDEIQADWELWQAAVAASGRDELLAALEKCVKTLRLWKLDKTLAGTEAAEAIKKARGES